MPNKQLKQVISWVAVVFWMGIIFYLSSQPASQSFNLSYDMIRVTIQVVKFSQWLMCFVLAYAAIKTLKRNKLKIGLKEMLIIALILIFLYVVSGMVLRYFAPADLHHFVRKNAHFFIYMVLGFLSKIAFENSGITGWKASILALMLCIFYASSDEWHQRFVPGRGGMLSDVIIDSTGAGIGIIGQSLLVKVKKTVQLKKIVQA